MRVLRNRNDWADMCRDELVFPEGVDAPTEYPVAGIVMNAESEVNYAYCLYWTADELQAIVDDLRSPNVDLTFFKMCAF